VAADETLGMFTTAQPHMQRGDEFRGARASPRAGFGATPKQSFRKELSSAELRFRTKVRDREDALASTRDACAPKDARSSAPEAHGPNQSPPLKPAQPENAEQSARNGRGLGNDRAANLNVVELELEVGAIRLSIGEQ
jgi:hypothetical protein